MKTRSDARKAVSDTPMYRMKGSSSTMTTAFPNVPTNALRLRLRSISERSDDGSSFRDLEKDLISEPPQTPPSTQSNNDRDFDRAAAEHSRLKDAMWNERLRQARVLLRSSSKFSREALMKQHRAIRGQLKTVQEEYKGTRGYDLELYEDVKTWLHLREKPHGWGFPAIGENRRDGSVRLVKNAVVLSKRQELPAEKNQGEYIANNRRSSVTATKNAILTPTTSISPKFSTREEAAKEMGRNFEKFKAEGRKDPKQYSDFLGDSPMRLFAQKANVDDNLPENSDAALKITGNLIDRNAGIAPKKNEPERDETWESANGLPLEGKNRRSFSTDTWLGESPSAIREDRPMPEEILDFNFAHDTHKLEDPDTNVEKGGREQFLFGETPYLQALMSAQIERDLVEGSLETEDNAVPHSFSPTVLATIKFALPQPPAKEVEDAKVILERMIRRSGFVVQSAKRKYEGGVDDDGCAGAGAKRVRVDGYELGPVDMDELGYESVEISGSELGPVVEQPHATFLPTRKGSLADIELAIDEARANG